MADSYVDLLNKGWDEIPEAQTWPKGSYTLKATKPRVDIDVFEAKDGGDKWSKITFLYRYVEAMADVNDADLEKMGDYDFSADAITKEFLFRSARDLDRVIKFIGAHGIEVEARTIPALVKALEEFKGVTVVGFVEPERYTTREGDVAERNKLVTIQKPE